MNDEKDLFGRLTLAASFYLDKKFSNVQVEGGGKTGGFPARHLLFQNVKKTGGGFSLPSG
jgi:hypothetical protein